MHVTTLFHSTTTQDAWHQFSSLTVSDGGFSDNVPILDSNTVTVSPFSGDNLFVRAAKNINCCWVLKFTFIILKETILLVLKLFFYQEELIYVPRMEMISGSTYPTQLSLFLQQTLSGWLQFFFPQTMRHCWRLLSKVTKMPGDFFKQDSQYQLLFFLVGTRLRTKKLSWSIWEWSLTRLTLKTQVCCRSWRRFLLAQRWLK